jgi:hypothetical protein
MNTRNFTLAALAIGVMFSAGAMAAGKHDTSEAQARYERERAVCLSGQSNQDRATCLREAGAALVEAKRQGLNDAQAQYNLNAEQRCGRLPDADRADCLARMHGQGTVSGSAAAGGIYRELVTRQVGEPGAEALPADAPPPPK